MTKNLVCILSAVCLMWVAASCSKKSSSAIANYTCNCVITLGSSVDSSHIPENSVTKANATTACNAMQSTLTAGNAGATVTCTLN
jgi:hypothetical protein